MSETGRPVFVVEPKGTTAAPAFCLVAVEAMPAPQECPEIAVLVNWPLIRARLDAGGAVGIAVDPADAGAVIDEAQRRCGFELVIRLARDGAVFLCRPGAVPWNDEDFSDDGGLTR